jgi:hypothetical protein
LLVLLGCRPKPPFPAIVPQSDHCRLGGNSVQAADTLTVALSDSVDLARASNPTNDSERLLFREFSETLIRLDCQGQIRPGLAVAWTSDTTGRVWTFALRDGTEFPAGSPTAEQVSLEWQTRPGALQAVGIESVTALDRQRLAVTLRGREDSVPRLFADPGLAFTQTDVPLGPVTRVVTAARGELPVLDFRAIPGSDPRDALDRGADLLVSRDPALVDYAARRPEFATYPLPWSRSYLLLQPRGAEPIEAIIASDSVRRSLARDAVRAEARAAEPPFWWDTVAGCRAVLGEGLGVSSSRIVYPRGDEVARGLAERIVALAHSGTQLRAAGLGEQELGAALRDGTERAYVVPVPRQSLVPCRDSAPWPSGVSIQPLIDTRARAILRRGSATLSVDWDGTVRVVDADPSKEAP